MTARDRVKLIAAHPVFLVFISLAVAAFFGILFSNGDLGAICTAGAIGTVTAVIAWAWAPRISRTTKAMCIIATTLVFTAETSAIYVHNHPAKSPEPKRLKSHLQPPVTLLVSPPKLRLLGEGVAKDHLYAGVKQEIPVRIGRVEIPQIGYAGFDLDNSKDDLALVMNADIENPTDKPVTLTFALSVLGEGIALSANNSGKGRWLRQMGVNDWITENDRKRGEKVDYYLLSPLTVAPHRLRQGMLVFVLTDPRQHKEAKAISDSGRFQFELRVTDVGTGKSASMLLPSRYPLLSDEALDAEMVRLGFKMKRL